MQLRDDSAKITFEQTSEHFDIHIRTLFCWQHKPEPCTTRNKPATKVDMDALLQDIETFPDDYQWKRVKRLGVGLPAIHYALKRLSITYKKNTKASQS